MIKKLKEYIKKILDKKGLRLISKEEYSETIEGIERLYQNSLFKDLPSIGKERVNLISNLLGTGIHEAFYLLNYLHKGLKLEGDVCEFGVAQGATSALMANEIKKTNKNIWLYDSFKGLPKPTEKDKLKDDIFNLGSMERYTGQMSNPVNLVKQKLTDIKFPFSRVQIVPGYIEKTIKTNSLPKKVCFAYLDFDFYEPTLIVLNSLDKVLSKGGFVMVDDYDFFSTGIKTAVNEFLNENKRKYELILPFKEAGHFCILKKIL